jgi:hypothetical protein
MPNLTLAHRMRRGSSTLHSSALIKIMVAQLRFKHNAYFSNVANLANRLVRIQYHDSLSATFSPKSTLNLIES